jgi:hypothetical protein
LFAGSGRVPVAAAAEVQVGTEYSSVGWRLHSSN